MPAQLWHAPTWAVGAGGGGTTTLRGAREGYQPPLCVRGGFQRLLSSWMLEVSLQLLLLRGGMAFCWDPRVSIPASGTGGWRDTWTRVVCLAGAGLSWCKAEVAGDVRDLRLQPVGLS